MEMIISCTKAKNMVYEIQNEMKRKIEQVSWIHDDAKTEAIKNVNSMKHNIGYPSWYDDEGKLDEFFDKVFSKKKSLSKKKIYIYIFQSAFRTPRVYLRRGAFLEKQILCITLVLIIR